MTSDSIFKAENLRQAISKSKTSAGHEEGNSITILINVERSEIQNRVETRLAVEERERMS